MLYVIYQDDERKIIILNNRYSRGRLRMKLLLKTDLEEDKIKEIVTKGVILSKAKTLKARGYGIAMTEQQNVLTVLWPEQGLIIYPDAHFERKYPLKNVIEGWFRGKINEIRAILG